MGLWVKALLLSVWARGVRNADSRGPRATESGSVSGKLSRCFVHPSAFFLKIEIELTYSIMLGKFKMYTHVDLIHLLYLLMYDYTHSVLVNTSLTLPSIIIISFL